MILYFSGTGNTRYAAQELGRLLDDNDVADMASFFSSGKITESAGERVVWCFPVYSWGVPPVVENFIKTVDFPSASQAKHYMLATCGDDAGLTDKQWRKLMQSRAWRDVGAHTIIMPNIYVLMKGFDVDPIEIVDKKLEEAPFAIKRISESIINGGPDTLIPGAFPGVKSRIIFPWFKKFAMSAKPFHALPGCTGCGLCSRSCPMGNIDMDAEGPRWNDKCAMCLRCYHICPQHVVAYGKSTDGKGVYRKLLSK